jgi:hypothetical protein
LILKAHWRRGKSVTVTMAVPACACVVMCLQLEGLGDPRIEQVSKVVVHYISMETSVEVFLRVRGRKARAVPVV